MMHQTTNVGMKMYPAYPADLHAQIVVQRRRHAPRSPKFWPMSSVPDLDQKSSPFDVYVLSKVLV